MVKQSTWPSVVLTLLALSIVYGVGTTFFTLELERWVERAIAAPFRLALRKDRPETGWDLVWTFAIYLPTIALLSLPFVVLHWPPGGGWIHWPF